MYSSSTYSKRYFVLIKSYLGQICLPLIQLLKGCSEFGQVVGFYFSHKILITGNSDYGYGKLNCQGLEPSCNSQRCFNLSQNAEILLDNLSILLPSIYVSPRNYVLAFYRPIQYLILRPEWGKLILVYMIKVRFEIFGVYRRLYSAVHFRPINVDLDGNLLSFETYPPLMPIGFLLFLPDISKSHICT